MLHSTSFRDALRRLLCTRRLDLISLAAAARRLLLAAVREGGTARRLPLKSSLARGSHGCGQSAEAAGAAVVRLWQLLRPLLCPCLTSTAKDGILLQAGEGYGGSGDYSDDPGSVHGGWTSYSGEELTCGADAAPVKR